MVRQHQVDQLADGSAGRRGFTDRIRRPILGRQIAYTYEVREIVQNERFVMATAQGPFPMETTYTWQDTPSGGTLMTLRNAGEPSGFGKMAAPMMASAMRRANHKDLQLLNSVLESLG